MSARREWVRFAVPFKVSQKVFFFAIVTTVDWNLILHLNICKATLCQYLLLKSITNKNELNFHNKTKSWQIHNPSEHSILFWSALRTFRVYSLWEIRAATLPLDALRGNYTYHYLCSDSNITVVNTRHPSRSIRGLLCFWRAHKERNTILVTRRTDLQQLKKT